MPASERSIRGPDPEALSKGPGFRWERRTHAQFSACPPALGPPIPAPLDGRPPPGRAPPGARASCTALLGCRGHCPLRETPLGPVLADLPQVSLIRGFPGWAQDGKAEDFQGISSAGYRELCYEAGWILAYCESPRSPHQGSSPFLAI